MNKNNILPFLSGQTIADKLYIFDSLESTNKTALEMSSAGAGHGTAVIAESQTAGRGRCGRPFASPPGHGIYMSVIISPEKSGFDSPELTTVFTAVCVCEAMEAVSYKKPGIKWVNDIFINEKKVCGILAEAAAENGRIRFVVTGIGINFNTPAQSFPDEIRFLAGPVFSNGETAVTREQLIAEILNRLLADIKIEKSELISKYKSRLITLGKRIEIKTPGKDETYRAEAVDIDDNGRLIIKTENGGLRIFSAGEISTNIN